MVRMFKNATLRLADFFFLSLFSLLGRDVRGPRLTNQVRGTLPCSSPCGASSAVPKEGCLVAHHCHYHQSLNREGRWGTTDDFATSFLIFSLFYIALWDQPNSRPVHSLMLSSHLFLCSTCLLLPFTVPCKMVLARPDEHTTAVCVSLQLSGGLRVVQLSAESWHGLPRW